MITAAMIFWIVVAFVIALGAVAYVLNDIDKAEDFETLKLRFAAVTFTGIMVLVLLLGMLALASGSEMAAEIFKTTVTALSPIAGGIIGYLFSSQKSVKKIRETKALVKERKRVGANQSHITSQGSKGASRRDRLTAAPA